MKAKSKSELASLAGVSLDTLAEWCRPYREELSAMGVKPNARVLPPKAVLFLAEKFCIDIDD